MENSEALPVERPAEEKVEESTVPSNSSLDLPRGNFNLASSMENSEALPVERPAEEKVEDSTIPSNTDMPEVHSEVKESKSEVQLETTDTVLPSSTAAEVVEQSQRATIEAEISDIQNEAVGESVEKDVLPEGIHQNIEEKVIGDETIESQKVEPSQTGEEKSDSDDELDEPGLPMEGEVENNDDEDEDEEEEEEEAGKKPSNRRKRPSRNDDDDEKEGEASKLNREIVFPDEIPIELETSFTTKPLGMVKTFVEPLYIIQSNPGNPPYDIGAIVCLENQFPLGRIFDVFGPIENPLYSVRRLVADSTPKDRIDAEVLIVIQTAKVINPSEIYKRGSDASFLMDEEMPENLQEFSDDEKEMLAKRDKKKTHQRQRGKDRRTRPRTDEYEANASQETNQQDTEPAFSSLSHAPAPIPVSSFFQQTPQTESNHEESSTL